MIEDVLICLEGSAGTWRAIDLAMAWAHELQAAQAHLLELRDLPAETIVAEMQRHDLIILARDLNFDVNADAHEAETRDAILRRAGKPLLVVPEELVAAGAAVLIAFDGSVAAKRALHSFAGSGLARARALHVAAVGDDGAVAWQVAEQGRALLREHGLTATAHNIVSTLSIAEALLERRDTLDAGLIVLGGYARSPASRQPWGSVTRELLEKTVVPLYLHY